MAINSFLLLLQVLKRCDDVGHAALGPERLFALLDQAERDAQKDFRALEE